MSNLITSIGQEDVSISNTGEEERYSTKLSFFGFDEDFYRHHDHMNVHGLQGCISLKIWPPVKSCKIYNEMSEFVFQPVTESNGGVGIYAANPECLQSIEVTAMMEWFQSFGISASFKNKASDAQILIYIKNIVCTIPESFDLQIRSNKIILLAADSTGVIYGMYALKQIILHHSTILFPLETKKISIPCLAIRDAPLHHQRAVRWSYQYQIKNAKTKAAAQIRMLSYLHYNTIFLDMDESVQMSAELGELADLCRKFNVQLILLLHISNDSPYQSYFKYISRTNITQMHLILDDIVAAEDMLVLLPMLSMTKITISSSLLFTSSSHIFEKIASYGIEVVDEAMLHHESFTNKPLVYTRPFFNDMLQYIKTKSDSLKPCSAFPMYQLRDFLTPDLIIKYYLALYGALLCHGESLESLWLETNLIEGIIDCVLDIILRPEEKVASNSRKKLLQLLSSDLSSLLVFSAHTPNSVPPSSTNSANPLSSNLGTFESSFWHLFMAVEDNQAGAFSVNYDRTMSFPPMEVSALSNLFYERVLLSVDFQLTSYKQSRNLMCRNQSSFVSALEIEEYFSLINTLALISRAYHVVQASVSDSKLNPSPSILPDTSTNAVGDQQVKAQFISSVLSEQQTPQQKRAAVYDNVDMSRPFTPKFFPKTYEISTLLKSVVQQNILFRNFKIEEHNRIVEAFECIKVKAGETVIKQGDAGEYFYIVESGQLEVYMENCGVHVKIGRTLSRGDYFGELALMYNTPRAATIISADFSLLWRIDRQTYRTIVTRHNKETNDEYLCLISNVCILNKRLGDVLSPAELSKVVSTLEIEEFEHDNVIIRQRQTGDYFYIISEGQIDVFQDQGPEDNAKESLTSGRMIGPLGIRVATLARGDYFGEKALLADDVRQASCIAVGKVVCLSLSRDVFIAMLGSWNDIVGVNRRGDNDAPDAAKKRRQLSVYDSNYHVSIHLPDLERLNTLGVGAFGRVSIARHKTSGQLYALKAQAKSGIVAQSMQEMVVNEMKIMKLLDHPLIAKLHAVMQDNRYVYFLLELLPGGEFFSFLQKAGKLSEDKARFYSASVVLAYEELNKNNIAYRDLKPENMVLDARGYVKLVDFGLAKQLSSDNTWTMCGTPDYLAPEIILNKGHNQAVDYWALGVLIFEMIHGWPPFYHDQPMRVYEKIILGKICYPDNFTKPLEDIISKFLVTNPSKRLGNMKGGLADIIKHKWFGSFDWMGLAAGTLLAPQVPDLTEFDAAIAASKEKPAAGDDEEHEVSDWMPDL